MTPEQPFSSVEQAVEAITQGEMVIVVDAEDRENEGDLICAAEKVSPQIINFMVKRGGGLVCLTVLEEVQQRLDLQRLSTPGQTPFDTPMATLIDHHSCKTGITAAERATTVLEAIRPSSKPTDFRPGGHVPTLIAKEGGVLRRAGHTEASVDLARMAGLTPAGVLCEILDERGDRASHDFLFQLAAEHKLKIITIEEMIRFRRQREKLVYRISEANLPTRYGQARVIIYGVKYEDHRPVVVQFGDLSRQEAPLIRLHSSCFTGDLLGSLRCDCGDQLQLALARLGDAGCGALVYLPQEGRGIGLVEKIKAYALQDTQGLDTVDANLALGHKADTRDYGIGIQILKDLGLSQVTLLTNNPKKTDAFIYGGFDLRVVKQEPILPPVHELNRNYLQTKRDRLGHQLPSDLLAITEAGPEAGGITSQQKGLSQPESESSLAAEQPEDS